jgi:uncharacterized protein YggE
MSEGMPGTAPGAVQVGGDGSVSAAPDLARVRLAGTALRPTVLDAMAAADGAVRRIRQAVGGLGVAAADAATRTISVAMEQDWSEKPPRTTGFRAEHALTVTVRDIARLGEVMGAGLAAGGDDVRLDGVEFAIADDAALRERAREAAWTDALSRAEQLARLAGRRLGPVLDVIEGVPPPGGVRPMAMAARAAAAPDVEPGSMDVEVRLTVRWALA